MSDRWVLKLSMCYLIMAFLMPNFLTYRSELRAICTLWRYGQLGFTLYLLLKYVAGRRLECAEVNLIGLYYGLVAISCAVDGTSLNAVKWELAPETGVVLLSFFLLKRCPRQYVTALKKIFVWYNLINLATLVLFPGAGIASGRIGQPVFFLGNKNVILPWIIGAWIFIILDSYTRYGKITARNFWLMILTSASGLISNSSAALLAVIGLWAALLADMIIKNKDAVRRLIGGRKLLVLAAGLFVVVIFMSGSGNIFTAFSDAIGKDVSFNGRTALWAVTLINIRENWLWGIGPSVVLDVGWGVSMTHAHCQYLNICLRYGAPALGVVLMYIAGCFRKVNKLPPLAYICMAALLVGAIIEVYPLHVLLLIGVVLGNYDIQRAMK